MKEKEIKPYRSNKSKKQEVESMFDGISSTYDKLNRILSLGIDKGWRKKLINKVDIDKVTKALDVATGTGDLCYALNQKGISNVVGLDLSSGMLEVAKAKLPSKKENGKISFLHGDAENLPFDDNTFDLVTVSFGVRNFENLAKGLAECKRVLNPSGQILILEFSQPRTVGFKNIYRFYSGKILPFVGGKLSNDKRAYQYLDYSAKKFPDGERFLKILNEVGFKDLSQERLTGGISTIYEGFKK